MRLVPTVLDLVPTPLGLVPTLLDQALIQPQTLPVPDSVFWCARPSLWNVLCFGVWVLGRQHTKTLSPAKARFGAGSVPDPAVLALDPTVLVLDPALLVLVSSCVHLFTFQWGGGQGGNPEV